MSYSKTKFKKKLPEGFVIYFLIHFFFSAYSGNVDINLYSPISLNLYIYMTVNDFWVTNENLPKVWT